MTVVIQNYTEFLGTDLILYGFTLIGDGKTEILLYDAEAIKSWSVDKYSLKAIKRYCRLYLQKNERSQNDTAKASRNQ